MDSILCWRSWGSCSGRLIGVVSETSLDRVATELILTESSENTRALVSDSSNKGFHIHIINELALFAELVQHGVNDNEGACTTNAGGAMNQQGSTNTAFRLISVLIVLVIKFIVA